MKRNVLMLLTLAGLMVGTAAVALAQAGASTQPAGAAEWTAVFTADLKNGKPADHWWTTVGEMKFTDGKLVMDAGKRGRGEAFLFTYRFPGSCRLEAVASVTPKQKVEDAGIDLKLNENAAVGTNPFRGYTFRLNAKGAVLLRDDTPLKSVGVDKFALAAGKSYQVVAEQNDRQLRLVVDGAEVISVQDPTPLEGPGLEMVGLAGRGGSLSVEKLVVSARKDKLADVVAPVAVPAGAEITVAGVSMCERACAVDQNQVEHNVVLFAMDGSPQVKSQVEAILEKFYPDRGLDCDQAKLLLEQFDKNLKYYLVPGPLAIQAHDDLDYPSRAISVTGTVLEKDGRKWLAPTKIVYQGKDQPLPFKYPAKLMAPDKPWIMPDKPPITLAVTDAISLKCVHIPPGRFLCGSPYYEHPRWQDEFPHDVTLTKGIYMAEIPVTQAMFEALTGKNPSKLPPTGFNQRFRHKTPDAGGDFAVENASYVDIQTFLQKMSEKNGRKVRLMTDAEFEWVARVGNSGPCFHEKYLQQRSFVADGEGRCEPVRKHPPNAWGVYDMVKSGWELVSDYKLDNIRTTQVDPQGPTRKEAANHGNGPLRRTKGGAFYDDTHLNMHGACDESGDNEEGLMIFRVVAELEPAAAAATAPAK
jgi:formylglycine-generating enzyme required for sulfatase activity